MCLVVEKKNPNTIWMRIMLQGCLHANMDLLKWCGVLFPLLPSVFVLRALRLAIWARTVDMRASPYDLAHWFRSTKRVHTLPVRAIAIETAQGRSEYAQEQRGIFETANDLRADMIRFMCDSSALDS